MLLVTFNVQFSARAGGMLSRLSASILAARIKSEITIAVPYPDDVIESIFHCLPCQLHQNTLLVNRVSVYFKNSGLRFFLEVLSDFFLRQSEF